MKRLLLLLVILIAEQSGQAALAGLPAAGFGDQESPEKRGAAETVIGEVVSVDKAAREVTVKTDQGATLTVKLDDNGICLRLPVGQTTLDKAVPIQLADIAAGDRVLSRGLMSEDKKQLRAHRLVVAARSEIDKKRESDLDQWRRRGIAGVVRDLNPQTQEINLEVRDRGGMSRVVVMTRRCSFRRYASGSASFVDAKPGSFGDLKVGDQLRALGDPTADGKGFEAEQIVSGSFQTLGCVVTEVDSLKNEIKAQTLDHKQAVVISLGKDSVLHRIPPQLALAIAKTVLGGSQGNAAHAPATGTGGQKLAQGSSGQKQATGAGEPKTAGPEGRAPDLQQMIKGLPRLTLADIKAGDTLAVTGTDGQDKSHMTAINVFAGVDAILNALKPPPGKRQAIAISAGLPVGVFDFSIGPPSTP